MPETPLLLLEFHGSEADVAEQSKNFAEIAGECGGGGFTWTTRPEDRTKLWQARHDAYWSVKALRPGAGVVATDVCVPISRLADCVTETEDDLKRLQLQSPIVGHVGDGNFHCSLFATSTMPARWRAAKSSCIAWSSGRSRWAAPAPANTASGRASRNICRGELGGEAIDAMRAIKQALDPQNIFNPGKIIPQA